MSNFTSDLTVTKLKNKKRLWRVDRVLEYHVGREGSKEVIRVPKGFITDFASVPRLFWMVIPPDGEYTAAAVVHDYLYHKHIYKRKRSDKIFLEAMKTLKVPFWKRRIMYRAVRLFGWVPWKKKREARK